MNPDLNRRDFLKTAGAAGIAGLAGCNTTGDGTETPEDGTTEGPTDTGTSTDSPPTSQESNYAIQASPLEYDLSSLSGSTAGEHDEADVRDNYSVDPGITLLEDGEDADLERLSEFHLENEEGEEVETTEEGYVPEYAVEDGEEVTVTGQVDNQTVQTTVTVEKEVPKEYVLDGKLIEEDGEVVFENNYDSPYEFDSHIVDRQELREERLEGMREHVPAGWLNVDYDEWEENWDTIQNWDDPEWKKKEYLLANARGFVTDAAGSQSPIDAQKFGQAFEIAIRDADFVDYDEVFIGEVSNGGPDGQGSYSTLVAYVEGDWYHLAVDQGEAFHIDTIMEDPSVMLMNKDPTNGAVSTLAGQGATDFPNFSPLSNNGWLDSAPALIDQEQGQWRLDMIQENSDWDEFMPIEEILRGAEKLETDKDIGNVAIGSGDDTEIRRIMSLDTESSEFAGLY